MPNENGCDRVKKELDNKIEKELARFTPTSEQDLKCLNTLLEVKELIRCGIEQSKKDVAQAIFDGGVVTRNDLEGFKQDIIDAVK